MILHNFKVMHTDWYNIRKQHRIIFIKTYVFCRLRRFFSPLADNFRPYLTSFQGNTFTDYINAVFVDVSTYNTINIHWYTICVYVLHALLVRSAVRYYVVINMSSTSRCNSRAMVRDSDDTHELTIFTMVHVWNLKRIHAQKTERLELYAIKGVPRQI